ncbi:MAG TPA: hypothetical protein VL181_00635, partial [Holophagaceae bacterium]|nr:hypothetical protein [Holophagaceae bacterium]
QAISSPDELVSLISSRRAGESVKLQILRDGKAQTLTVKLGDRKDMGPAGQDDEDQGGPQDPGQPGSQGLNLDKNYGFQVGDLTQANRYQFGVPEGVKGVVVTSVSPRSGAADSLSPGLVITSVGRAQVGDVQEFDAQARKFSGKPLLLYVQSPRGDQKATVAVPPSH